MDIVAPAGMSYEFYMELMKGENNVCNGWTELPKL